MASNSPRLHDIESEVSGDELEISTDSITVNNATTQDEADPNSNEILQRTIIGLCDLMKHVFDLDKGCYKYPVQATHLMIRSQKIFSDVYKVVQNEMRDKGDKLAKDMGQAVSDLAQMFLNNYISAADNYGSLQRKYDTLISRMDGMEKRLTENQEFLKNQIESSNTMTSVKTEGLAVLVAKLEEQTANVASFVHIINDALLTQKVVASQETPKIDIPSHKKLTDGIHSLVCHTEKQLTGALHNTVENIANSVGITGARIANRIERVKNGLKDTHWTESQVAILVLPFFPTLRGKVQKIYQYYKSIYDTEDKIRYEKLAAKLNELPIIQSNLACRPITRVIPIQPISALQYHAKPRSSRYQAKKK